MPPITSIENVVTNVVYEGPLRERLCKVFDTARITQIAPGEPQQLKQALDQADIAVLSELLPASQITGSRLKWVHITHAGLDKVARPEILRIDEATSLCRRACTKSFVRKTEINQLAC